MGIVEVERVPEPLEQGAVGKDCHLAGHLAVLAVSKVALGTETKISTEQKPTGIPQAHVGQGNRLQPTGLLLVRSLTTRALITTTTVASVETLGTASKAVP